MYKEPPHRLAEPFQVYPQDRSATLGRAAARPKERGEVAFAALRLSPEAKKSWEIYADTTERRHGKGGDLEHFTDSGSKAADNVARLAALFHLYEVGTPVYELGIHRPISQDHIERAIRIIDWHLEQAKQLLTRVLASVGAQERD